MRLHPTYPTRYTILFFSAFLIAVRAYGVGGVIEINQARALAGGVTPGDAPGFPVSIGQSGSYRLTSNLDLTSQPNVNAIAIFAPDVTIDLNGFAILGPTVCTGGPPITSCSPSTTGDGISDASTTALNTVVRNGTVQGMGEGIRLLDGRVEDVRVIGNASTGISLSNLGGAVIDCDLSSNLFDGLDVGLQVVGTTGPALVRGNTFRNNGSLGVGCFVSCNLSSNIARNNGASGFAASGRISDNVSDGNLGMGFIINGGSTVIGNRAHSNAGVGFSFPDVSGYADNVLTGNNGGDTHPQVNGVGIQTGLNVCGTSLCGATPPPSPTVTPTVP